MKGCLLVSFDNRETLPLKSVKCQLIPLTVFAFPDNGYLLRAPGLGRPSHWRSAKAENYRTLLRSPETCTNPQHCAGLFFLITVSVEARTLTGNSRLIAIYGKIATVYYGL